MKDPSEGPQLPHSSYAVAPNTPFPSPETLPCSLERHAPPALPHSPPIPPKTPKPFLTHFARSSNSFGKTHFGPLFDPQVTPADPTIASARGALVPLAANTPSPSPETLTRSLPSLRRHAQGLAIVVIFQRFLGTCTG